ncbi:hypothetical protein GOP47_0006061 [Adiantum capillus-veneris]|uniref:Uncharacterized protein n=1 Tax=Adiantum capillus-veneris TaxID=13818 RepID=A0A9D4V253_ADICA|nr:hypothetical protein GOP47_0006061 [Adiantum capillus-veneris]
MWQTIEVKQLELGRSARKEGRKMIELKETMMYQALFDKWLIELEWDYKFYSWKGGGFTAACWKLIY